MQGREQGIGFLGKRQHREPPPHQLRGLESTVSSPVGVQGKATAAKSFGAFYCRGNTCMIYYECISTWYCWKSKPTPHQNFRPPVTRSFSTSEWLNPRTIRQIEHCSGLCMVGCSCMLSSPTP